VLATPNVADWLNRVQQAQSALAQRHSVLRRAAGERLETLRARLDRAHPQRRLQQNEQRLDELEARLIAAFTRGRARATERLGNASARLRAATPQRRLRLALRELESLQLALHGAQQRNLAQAEQRRARAESLLLAVNPKAVLERGYAIVSNAQGQVVRSVQAVRAGDALRLSLVDGQLGVHVDSDTDPSRS
jgi:exodeoxyribonuclease VII large subunit